MYIVRLCALFVYLVYLLPIISGGIEFTASKMKYYRQKVKRMFYHAYDGYLENAYPFDELKPISCKGMDTWGSYSLTLVDTLDTLLIMGNVSEFRRTAELVLKAIDFNANVNVSVFETNIRIIGGLLSAHMLSGMAEAQLEEGWPCNGPLLRLAERLANKLMPAFNSLTGMPYGTVNLRYGVHKLETPITCTAGVGTYLLEFGTLSRLTGNPHYERVALKALQELWKAKSSIGLVGNHINVQTGQWTATDAGIGAGVDSYFEYLAKGAVLFQNPKLMAQFKAYKASVNKHLRHNDWFLWVAMNKGTVSMPVFQSLEQFWPGLLTLIGDSNSAMRIISNYHQILKRYGFSPEFYNIPQMELVAKRSGYPLRPEFVESLMYLYQAKRDPLLLQMGVDVLEAIEHSCKTKCGYATVHNTYDHTIEDRMESFFLAETIKYLYLLFDPNSFVHNPGLHGRVIDTVDGKCVIETGGYIFNTEAHLIDPSILYCCSKQRVQDLKLLEDFQRNLDLVTLFGFNNPDVVPDYLSSERSNDEVINIEPLKESDVSSDDTYDRASFQNPPSQKVVEQEIRTSAEKLKKPVDTVVSALEGLLQDMRRLLGITKQVDTIADELANFCTGYGQRDDFCRKDVCHVREKSTGSSKLDFVLRMLYKRKLRSDGYQLSPLPVCLFSQAPKESDHYWSDLPDFQNIQIDKELLADFINITVSEIDLYKFRVEDLQEFQSKLMNCKAESPWNRLFAGGEVLSETD